jgi:hypothetical protein
MGAIKITIAACARMRARLAAGTPTSSVNAVAAPVTIRLLVK